MAVERPITFIQGDDAVVGFDLWQDLEQTVPAAGLSGYDFRMQIRRSPKAPVILELTSDNGLIVLNETFVPELDENDDPVLDNEGEPVTVLSKSSILIYFTHDDSTDLPAETDLGYDLELTNGDYTQTLFYGTINLQAEYTK